MSLGLAAIGAYLKLHFAGHDIPALMTHLETAIGEKVTEAVGGVQHVIDDLKGELAGLGTLKATVADLENKVAHPLVSVDQGASHAETVKAHVEQLVPALNDKITGELKAATDAISASIEGQVTALFNSLLAKAAAVDAPKGPENAPVAAVDAPQLAAAAAAPVVPQA